MTDPERRAKTDPEDDAPQAKDADDAAAGENSRDSDGGSSHEPGADDESDGEDWESDDEQDEDSDPDAVEREQDDGGRTPRQRAAGPTGGRAHDVARALGVGEEAEGEEGAADEVDNRAERRRQRALRRRAARRRERQAQDEVEPRAKDRNVRRREALLNKRRRAAAAPDDLPADRLLPSEMVDDALARGGAATIKWVKRNWRVLQWTIVVVVLAGGGYLYWSYRTESGAQQSADGLAHAVEAEEAVVIPADQDDRTEEQKKADLRKVFASVAERDKAVLSGYRSVEETYHGTGAAMLAKLGEAGALLDDRKWDEALAAYAAVLDSPLAKADPDVRARALEGKGLAQEGKGDSSSAASAFKALGEIPQSGFAVLSKYHQARLLVGQGKQDDAKKLLLAARKQLEEAKLQALKDYGSAPYRWLERMVTEELGAIDPAAVGPQVKPGGGAALPADIRKKLEEKGLMPGRPSR